MSALVYELGPFRLDADKAVLWRAGEVVSLTPKALALLHALVRARGDVVPKADLMSHVWPDTAVQDANLSVTVAALRRAPGVRDGERPWIQTLPRREYRFDGPLKGPPGDALGELERAAVERDPWVVFLAADESLAALRGEPRFDRLVARVHGRD